MRPLGVVGQIIPVEFSDSDGRMEIGTSAGCRTIVGTETGRTDPGVDFGANAGNHWRFDSCRVVNIVNGIGRKPGVGYQQAHQ